MSTQNQLTQLNFKYGKYSNKVNIENGTIGFASFEKDNTGTFIVKLNDKIYNTMPPSSTDETLVGAPLVSGEANTSSYYAKTLSTYHGGTGLDKDTLKSHMLYFVPALDGIAQNKMIPMNSYIDEQCLTIGDINPNLYNSGLKADNVETLMTTVRSALFDFQDIACPMASIHYGGISDVFLELPSVDGTLIATNFNSIRPITDETKSLTAFSTDNWGALDQLDSLRYQSSVRQQGPYYYNMVDLLIGNARVSSNSATYGNARGAITLYDNSSNYVQILTKDLLKGSVKFYLPDGISNEETEIYGVGFKKSIKNDEPGIWGQGSSSLPVYVDASGEILPCKNSDLFSNLSWETGTAIGPTLSATIAGLTLSASIPVATKTQSGIITTTNQAFAGIKQFETLKTQSIYPLEKAKFNLGNSLTPWAQVSSQAYNLCGPVIYQDTSKSYAKTEYTLEQAQVQAQQECGKAYKIIQTEETETDYIITLQKTLETKGGDFWTNTTEGDSVRATTLNLGNQASSNPSFNRYGILTIYDRNNCWASVRTRNYMDRNSIFYLPDGASDTYAVWSTATITNNIINQTTGDTDIPIYVNNKGQLVACADNVVNIYAHATAPNENGEITNYKCKAASLIADNKDTLDPRPVLLTLGTKTNESGNRYGQIRLHSQAVPTSGSVTIETRSGLTKDITFFLPPGRKETKTVNGVETTNYITDCYAVWIDQEQSVVGSDTQPVYIDGTGKVLPGYLYAGGTNVTLNGTSYSAQTATFYAPLSGGSVAEGSDTQVLIAQGDKKAPIWVNQSTLKATLDANGKEIIKIYETKSDATSKLAEAKKYADDIKSALLGTGTISKTYDTLKEIADWITDSGVDTADLASAIAEETKNRKAAISALTVTAENGITTSGSLSIDGGLTISGVAASDEVPGIVIIGDQTFAGAKTFTGATTLLSTLSVLGATTIGVENGDTSLIVHGTATIKGAATLGTDYVDTITLQGKTVLTKDVQYGEKAPSENDSLTNPAEGQIYFKLI